MANGSALFDTNILIDLFSGRREAKQALDAWPPQNAISLITWMEVMVGAKKYNQEHRTRVAMSAFNIIGVSQEIAERSVALRQEYGMKLPDAIILATAQVHHLELVTRNTKDFADIPGVATPYEL
ncbi:type II toxin-antitoxin system VapC family toxin [Citrobacter sp. Marseille-Q6884]|uniref:type II toxin-antitoxin system VapC family toxin n=1 Tax=Citrobacter sp. Marseille-Q6884 TaxID=2956786 RepID=UPI0021B38CE9|nr:type II toxin-antitoxin system VapC family toxin [Citrobacter sp. Marseille-Q6884]